MNPINMEHNQDASEERVDAVPKAKKRRNPFNLQQIKEEKERRQKKKARLIVRNISYKVTEELLKKHFEQWGTIEDLNILKRADGRLVGCAFVQYETINQATKAILKGNNQKFLGRPVYIDWAVGKDEFISRKVPKEEPADKKPKLELEEEERVKDEVENKTIEDEEIKSDVDSSDDEEENDAADISSDNDDNDSVDDSEVEKSDEDIESNDENENKDEKDLKTKKNINKVKKEKTISNDVQEGCTVFLKEVPFDAEDQDLRKVCRKFGPLYYAIINRDKISGHSKGTAFVKFKTKESADLCLQAGSEFVLMDQVLDPHPALSRDEMRNQAAEKSKKEDSKDSRNLYLAREGLIMSGSKAAEGVSASDMTKRHKLEQVKTQVLKNLNRFVSRNRLSLHNLPLSYDNDKLKQLILSYTGLKPHECRVMRESKITPEHPKGKSKGFGFMSFNTHKDALTALRKLNNNPKVFGPLHRPIVAFSIEDRAVHKIKDMRNKKAKLNNPTFKKKIENRKEARAQKANGKLKSLPKGPQSDNKAKLKKHIEKLEKMRANKSKPNKVANEDHEDFVGTAAKQGTSIQMRSNKKIKEQAEEHKKRVKANKRKLKQQKIKQIHLAERKAIDRPKQKRKNEKDDLSHLVNKYKSMINNKANQGTTNGIIKTKKPKRTKWYTE
ncbi:RNA-binding protein 28 [Teleopsis dalmanni]|uniref:RNA-binding protein 28 n=1 Tax=Teleopsis dalmanni TaxID=139649 RepID=UPI0018CDC57B|nr:RNA-binding protein 28 [Teleopsis dalmanni]